MEAVSSMIGPLLKRNQSETNVPETSMMQSHNDGIKICLYDTIITVAWLNKEGHSVEERFGWRREDTSPCGAPHLGCRTMDQV